MSKLRPGHGWAYTGVIFGLIGSVAGNVANTVLVDSLVDLKLRIPFAVAWPVFIGIGIEVLTRVEWERNWRHWIARLLLMGPMTLVAGVMSWIHLNHLMKLTGEPELAQIIGPLAIDGTMFGCTVALLVTRAASRGQDSTSRKSLAERVSAARSTISEVAAAAKGTPAVESTEERFVAGPPLDLDRELAELVDEAKPRSPKIMRTYPTRGAWDIQKAVELIAEAELGDQAIADLVGTGMKQVQRTRRAYRHLRTDPRATVPTEWKVPAAVLDIIRREVSR